MAEAANSVHQKLRASMAFAARVRALQVATNGVKAQLQRQGTRLSQVTYRIVRTQALRVQSWAVAGVESSL